MTCVWVSIQKMERRSVIILGSIWQFAAFPYIQAVRKAAKLQNKNQRALFIQLIYSQRKMFFSLVTSVGQRKKNFLSQVILMMTSTQVFETSVTTTDNSPSQGYTYPVDQTTLLHVTEMQYNSLAVKGLGTRLVPWALLHYKGSLGVYCLNRPERLRVSTKFLICIRSDSSPSLAIERMSCLSQP